MRRWAKTITMAVVAGLVGTSTAWLPPVTAGASDPGIEADLSALGGPTPRVDLPGVPAFATATVNGVVVPADPLASSVTAQALVYPDVVLDALDAQVSSITNTVSQTAYVVDVGFADPNRPRKQFAGRIGVPTMVEIDSSHYGPELQVLFLAFPGGGATTAVIDIQRGLYTAADAPLKGIDVQVHITPDSNDLARTLGIGYQVEGEVPVPQRFRASATLSAAPEGAGTAVQGAITLAKAQPIRLLGSTFKEAPGVSDRSAFGVSLANAPTTLTLDAVLPTPDDPAACTKGTGLAPGKVDTNPKLSIGVSLPTPTTATFAGVSKLTPAETLAISGSTDLPAATKTAGSMAAGITMGARAAADCSRPVQSVNYRASGPVSLSTAATISEPGEPTQHIFGRVKGLPSSLDVAIHGEKHFSLESATPVGSIEVGVSSGRPPTLRTDLPETEDYVLLQTDVERIVDTDPARSAEPLHGIHDTEASSSAAARVVKVSKADLDLTDGKVVASLEHVPTKLTARIQDLIEHTCRSGCPTPIADEVTSTDVVVDRVPAVVGRGEGAARLPGFVIDPKAKAVTFRGSERIARVDVDVVDHAWDRCCKKEIDGREYTLLADDLGRSTIDVTALDLPTTVERLTYDIAGDLGPRQVIFEADSHVGAVEVVASDGTDTVAADVRGLPRGVVLTLSDPEAYDEASPHGASAENTITVDTTGGPRGAGPSTTDDLIGFVDVKVLDTPDLATALADPRYQFLYRKDRPAGQNRQGLRTVDRNGADGQFTELYFEEVGDATVITRSSQSPVITTNLGFIGLTIENRVRDKAFDVTAEIAPGHPLLVDAISPKKDACGNLLGGDDVITATVNKRPAAATLQMYTKNLHSKLTQLDPSGENPPWVSCPISLEKLDLTSGNEGAPGDARLTLDAAVGGANQLLHGTVAPLPAKARFCLDTKTRSCIDGAPGYAPEPPSGPWLPTWTHERCQQQKEQDDWLECRMSWAQRHGRAKGTSLLFDATSEVTTSWYLCSEGCPDPARRVLDIRNLRAQHVGMLLNPPDGDTRPSKFVRLYLNTNDTPVSVDHLYLDTDLTSDDQQGEFSLTLGLPHAQDPNRRFRISHNAIWVIGFDVWSFGGFGTCPKDMKLQVASVPDFAVYPALGTICNFLDDAEP